MQLVQLQKNKIKIIFYFFFLGDFSSQCGHVGITNINKPFKRIIVPTTIHMSQFVYILARINTTPITINFPAQHLGHVPPQHISPIKTPPLFDILGSKLLSIKALLKNSRNIILGQNQSVRSAHKIQSRQKFVFH